MKTRFYTRRGAIRYMQSIGWRLLMIDDNGNAWMIAGGVFYQQCKITRKAWFNWTVTK